MRNEAELVGVQTGESGGAITLTYWWFAGDRAHALTRTTAVLIIACPHALGLAIPLVIAISTSLGGQNGLLVKDRLALEGARDLDVVVFDKTGTLYARRSSVVQRGGCVRGSRRRFVFACCCRRKRFGTSARQSDCCRGQTARPPIAAASHFEALPSRGAQAFVNGESIAIGSLRLLSERNAAPPPELVKVTAAWAADTKTVLLVVSLNGVLGAFAVEDEIRPQSNQAVEELHRLGIRVAMITGDSRTVAESVARRIGIDEVAAEVLPADKASAIQRFQAGGEQVAMVGDAVNDAPALTTANVGIAIGPGTDVAVESAGIVLVRSDPRDVVEAIELSRASYRKMVQNLIWATAYNLAAIPVAAGLLVHWDVDLPMSVGALAMSLSTLIVGVNAQLLRRVNLRRSPS